MFADWSTRDGPRPTQAARLSRFTTFELLSCRNRAARSFNLASGSAHLDIISRNTVCLNQCGSSFQCATTLCPKLRRMTSDACWETVSATVAQAPPSFSQFESTFELLYRFWSCKLILLVPFHRHVAGRALPCPNLCQAPATIPSSTPLAGMAGQLPISRSATGHPRRGKRCRYALVRGYCDRWSQ